MKNTAHLVVAALCILATGVQADTSLSPGEKRLIGGETQLRPNREAYKSMHRARELTDNNVATGVNQADRFLELVEQVSAANSGDPETYALFSELLDINQQLIEQGAEGEVNAREWRKKAVALAYSSEVPTASSVTPALQTQVDRLRLNLGDEAVFSMDARQRQQIGHRAMLDRAFSRLAKARLNRIGRSGFQGITTMNDVFDIYETSIYAELLGWDLQNLGQGNAIAIEARIIEIQEQAAGRSTYAEGIERIAKGAAQLSEALEEVVVDEEIPTNPYRELQ
ncbi:MAG: hypothetical protein ACFHX7_22055 [Pseudomonadota bacterium]